MKRVLIIGSIFVFLISACLPAPKNTQLSDKYGAVTVFASPT